MTTDTPASREQQARDVLANHAERNGYPLSAKSIRAGDDPYFNRVVIEAMLAFADAPRPSLSINGEPATSADITAIGARMDAEDGGYPTPRPKSASVYCNKCGFYGDPQSGGFHLRPKNGEPCNYAAPSAERPTQVAESREAIARIIDPVSFGGGVNYSPRRAREALAKADAILAALSQHDGEEG